MQNSLVSVVMPSFNQAKFIEQSVRSVLDQSHTNVELIVQDGQSTDGTCEKLETLQQEFDRLSWISEPDDGPADAINKAFSIARGEIIGWLNSDDLYSRGAVARAVEAFDQNPRWIMCYGHGEHVDIDGVRIDAYPTLKPDVGLAGFRSGCFICQPTAFFKTSMLSLIGKLDSTLKTTFDYEFWLRAFQALQDRIGFIDRVQAHSRLHDDCITNNLRESIALEGLMLSVKFFNTPQTHWVTTHLEELKSDFPDQRQFQSAAIRFLEKCKVHLTEELLEQYVELAR
ncbi:MAG: glycosyltransferase [Hyphomonas sp.]|nr:glycosyltransferase [Hyphomonas sp.]